MLLRCCIEDPPPLAHDCGGHSSVPGIPCSHHQTWWHLAAITTVCLCHVSRAMASHHPCRRLGLGTTHPQDVTWCQSRCDTSLEVCVGDVLPSLVLAACIQAVLGLHNVRQLAWKMYAKQLFPVRGVCSWRPAPDWEQRQ